MDESCWKGGRKGVSLSLQLDGTPIHSSGFHELSCFLVMTVKDQPLNPSTHRPSLAVETT